MTVRIAWCVLLIVAGSIGAHAEPWRLIREAEQAETVVSPAHVVPNPQARQGQCVMLSEGGASVRSSLRELSATTGAKRGELDFDVDLPQAGRYCVWVRAQWHCTCSNSFYLLTTGTPQWPETGTPSREEDASEPYRVKASVPPRAWRWFPATTCDFSAGPQKLRLIQAGHEALIDAIMLTSDPEDRPPGYEDQSRTHVFALREKDEEKPRPEDGIEQVEWVRNGADAACPLGTADWADFQLEFVALPDEREPERAVDWGVEYARQPNGSAYTLTFSPAGNGTTNIRLCALENGQRRTLASQDCNLLEANQSHWIRVIRLAKNMTVAVDGTVRLTASDDTLASGPIALLAPQSEGFQFQGLQLHPLDNHIEHFQAGAADWQTHAGTWQTVKLDGSDNDPMVCTAKATDQGGLLAAPWNLGNAYILNTQVQLAQEGAAGFAFDIHDAQNYRAALLHWKDDGTVELEFQQIIQGKSETVQSHLTTVDPRQWHALRLTRHSAFAKVQLDGVDFAKCWAATPAESTGVGLALAPTSACLFGQVSAETYTSPTNDEFLVEGPEAPKTLSQWKPVDGVTRIQGHPAAIFLSSERVGEDAALRLDRNTTGDARLEVTFYKYRSAPAQPADPLSVVPELTLPPLPDAPRVGLVFHRNENGQPVEYALQSDWETLRETTLQRNGKILERTYSTKQAHPEGYKLFLQLKGNTLSGGIAGVSEIHTTLPAPQSDADPTAVSIATQNLAPHQEAGIVEIRLFN